MKTGISTASLFLRAYNEEAIKIISGMGAQTCEVFLATFSEYTKIFAEKVKESSGGINIHSVHSLTTHFEPQLYSEHSRAQSDAYQILDNFLEAAKILGAKYYTFHGVSRLKNKNAAIDIDKCAYYTSKIISECEKYAITLTYENVHWAYYNYIGFFSELKKRCPKLKGVLDIKQARRNNIDYKKFLSEMGEDIVTVHLSDFKSDGTMVLPGKGDFDFTELFKILKDNGFDGAALIEVYENDYKEVSELKQSLEYINELKYRIF